MTKEEFLKELEYLKLEPDIIEKLLNLVGVKHPSFNDVFDYRSILNYVDIYHLFRGRFGWLDLNGRFYSCAYAGHERLLYALGMSISEAEKLGWVRVIFTVPEYDSLYKVNPKQRKALKALGVEVDRVEEMGKLIIPDTPLYKVISNEYRGQSTYLGDCFTSKRETDNHYIRYTCGREVEIDKKDVIKIR